MRELKGIFAILLVQANSICVPLSKFNEGSMRGSLAWFTNLKNRGLRFMDIKNSFSQITKIRK